MDDDSWSWPTGIRRGFFIVCLFVLFVCLIILGVT